VAQKSVSRSLRRVSSSLSSSFNIGFHSFLPGGLHHAPPWG
jgi:hypothetical protein